MHLSERIYNNFKIALNGALFVYFIFQQNHSKRVFFFGLKYIFEEIKMFFAPYKTSYYKHICPVNTPQERCKRYKKNLKNRNEI